LASVAHDWDAQHSIGSTRPPSGGGGLVPDLSCSTSISWPTHTFHIQYPLTTWSIPLLGIEPDARNRWPPFSSAYSVSNSSARLSHRFRQPEGLPTLASGALPFASFAISSTLVRLHLPTPTIRSCNNESSETSSPRLSLAVSIWPPAEGEYSHTRLLPPSKKSSRIASKSSTYSSSWCSASRPMRSTFPFPHPGQQSPSRMSSYANENVMFLPPGNPQLSSPGARRSH